MKDLRRANCVWVFSPISVWQYHHKQPGNWPLVGNILTWTLWIRIELWIGLLRSITDSNDYRFCDVSWVILVNKILKNSLNLNSVIIITPVLCYPLLLLLSACLIITLRRKTMLTDSILSSLHRGKNRASIVLLRKWMCWSMIFAQPCGRSPRSPRTTFW